MNKVYFSKEKNHWFVYEPKDFYTFKSVNISTNEEVNQILSWTRGFDMSNYPNHIRIYDVEIDNVKYFFLMKQEGIFYTLETEDPMRLNDLLKRSNLFFTGESL